MINSETEIRNYVNNDGSVSVAIILTDAQAYAVARALGVAPDIAQDDAPAAAVDGWLDCAVSVALPLTRWLKHGETTGDDLRDVRRPVAALSAEHGINRVVASRAASAGKIDGAVRVGHTWHVLPSAFLRWAASRPGPGAPHGNKNWMKRSTAK